MKATIDFDREQERSRSEDSGQPELALEQSFDRSSSAEPNVQATISNYRLASIVILLILVVSASWVLIRKKAPSNNDLGEPLQALSAVDPAPLPVSMIEVGSVVPPAQTRSYSGIIIAGFESMLGFERAGRVKSLSAHEGAMVAPGDVLAELMQDDLDAKQQRTESELAAAEALLAELVAGPRRQALMAARAKVDELEARVRLAQVDADRQTKLAPQGATSRSQLDSAVFGYQASQQTLEAAKAVLQELEEGTRIEKVDAQRAKCGAIRSSLLEIKAERSDSRIIAPFSGAIQSRMLDEGAIVSPGTPVLHLVSQRVEAQFGLPPSVARRMVVGEKVTMGIDNETKQGWVDRVSPTISRDTRTRDVFVRFQETSADDSTALFTEIAKSGWVAGEIVSLQVDRMTVATDSDKYWLPTTALSRASKGLWNVLVVPGTSNRGICERRSVEVLKTDGSYALVQGMLHLNERVIADGLHRVTAGMNVCFKNDPESDPRGAQP